MTETISPNSDAILLLTAPLAVRGEVQEGIEPLSTENMDSSRGSFSI